MVSIEGYEISEYLFFTIATYVLASFSIILEMMKKTIKDEGILKAFFWGLAFLVFCSVLYTMPVRIGFVFFLNGAILANIVNQSIEVYGGWKWMRGETQW